MFYNVKKAVFVLLSLLFVAATGNVKAQGLVSLSEEAMFEDGLESNTEEEVATEAPAVEKTAEAQDLESIVTPKDNTAAPLETNPEVLPQASLPELPEVLVPEENVNSEEFSADLFSKMSDLEKKTALMNLELRRERLQNEIEAVKNQRKQAIIQEQERAEAARLKSIEQEKEAERKLLEEQEKLRELDIKFEILRQEKVLGAYKNKMLEENQKWIEHNAGFYKKIADLRKVNQQMATSTKDKMEEIQKEAEKAHQGYLSRIDGFRRENQDLQSQLSVLRSRIKDLEREREEARKNPFANAAADSALVADSSQSGSESGSAFEPQKTALSHLYAVTEIRGKGDELIAKLINRNGTAFYVKKGTILQSGHTIADITTTYVLAERAGERDYIYFAAGGILPTETSDFRVERESEE